MALAALLTSLLLCAGVAAAALAQGTTDPPPTVFDVTPTSAQVTAMVDPPGDVGSYRFEWSTDESYGTGGDPIALGIQTGARGVGGTLTGLQPSTTYHVRVVVTGAGDPVVSAGTAFRTSADPTPTEPEEDDPGVGTGAQLEPSETVETDPPDPTDAVQGEAVVLGPERGTVMVKQTGTDEYATLEAGTPVPVGSMIDTSAGTVRLISQTEDDGTDDVVLRGSKFEVRQAKDGSGVTEFVLKGGNFSVCGKATTAAKKKKPRRSLWAKDQGGQFRTRGLNSVATVRGTTWRVTDTCSGTTTTVSDGSVMVREIRGGRSVVVRKGHRHLARARR